MRMGIRLQHTLISPSCIAIEIPAKGSRILWTFWLKTPNCKLHGKWQQCWSSASPSRRLQLQRYTQQGSIATIQRERPIHKLYNIPRASSKSPPKTAMIVLIVLQGTPIVDLERWTAPSCTWAVTKWAIQGEFWSKPESPGVATANTLL
jgi:hypothetical protein